MMGLQVSSTEGTTRRGTAPVTTNVTKARLGRTAGRIRPRRYFPARKSILKVHQKQRQFVQPAARSQTLVTKGPWSPLACSSHQPSPRSRDPAGPSAPHPRRTRLCERRKTGVCAIRGHGAHTNCCPRIALSASGGRAQEQSVIYHIACNAGGYVGNGTARCQQLLPSSSPSCRQGSSRSPATRCLKKIPFFFPSSEEPFCSQLSLFQQCQPNPFLSS